MKNYIQIKKKYLLFREDAQNLAGLVHEKNEENKSRIIFLDFSCVEFMSRSFIDELINILHQLKGDGIGVRIACLKPPLQDFISRVKKTKNRIQNILASESQK